MNEISARRIPTDELSPSQLLGSEFLTDERCVLIRAQHEFITFVTSGSTGTPARFTKTGSQLLGEAEALVALLGLTPSDVVLTTTAFHHLYGFLFGVLAPLLSGAKLVIDDGNEPGQFHPQQIASLAQQTGATLLVTVPAHLGPLVVAGPALGPLRGIVSSAARLDRGLAQAAESRWKLEVTDVLGSTETGGIATRRTSRTEKWSPLSNVRVSTNQAGKLIVDSPFSDRRPHTTQELATVDEDGRFSYQGRSDGIVKVGGKRVSLRAIEQQCLALAGVSDACALAQPGSTLRGQEIWLAVAATDWSVSDIRSALGQLLDGTSRPRRIVVVSEIKRSDRGKVVRSALLQLFEDPLGTD